MAGGWWYLLTDGGVGGIGACGARMLLGVCAVPVVLVCAVRVLCLVDVVWVWFGSRVGWYVVG